MWKKFDIFTKWQFGWIQNLVVWLPFWCSIFHFVVSYITQIFYFVVSYYIIQRNPFGHFSDKPFAPDRAIPWQTQNINVKFWDEILGKTKTFPKMQNCDSNWFFAGDEIPSSTSTPLVWQKMFHRYITVWTQYPCLPFPVRALARLGVMFAQYPSCGRKPHQCDHFSLYLGGAIWEAFK